MGDKVKDLLQNNLALFRSENIEIPFFTCALTQDGDLPWDPEEIDF